MLEKLRARLKGLLDELKVIQAKDTMTAEDLKKLNEINAEIEGDETKGVLGLEAQIKALELSEQIQARAAKPADVVVPGADREVTRGDNLPEGMKLIAAEAHKALSAEDKFCLSAAAAYKAKHLGQPVLKVLADNGYGLLAKEMEMGARQKAIDTSSITALLPAAVSSQVVELLRPETAFLKGGPKKIEFVNGKFQSIRVVSGTSASYVGEGAKKPVTDAQFETFQMTPKKLAAIVLITKEAKKWSVPSIADWIRDDLRRSMSQKIDLTAFFGVGSPTAPTGIFNLPNVPQFNVEAVSPTAPTLAEVDAVARRMILSLTVANISASPKWAWLMNYKTLEYLKSMRVGDNDGAYAFPDLHKENPTFKGFRVLVTNQVPGNLGTGSDESYLGLIDFRYVLFGEEQGIEFSVSTEATIDIDGNGTLVHLFQQNMEAILGEAEHDFNIEYARAAVLAKGIRWGENGGSPNF